MQIKKIFLLLFVIFCSKLYCQKYLALQFEIAENLFKNERYFDAITELKRLIFFDSSKLYSYKSYFMIGKAYKSGAKLNEAIENFTFSAIYAKTDSQLYQAKIEIIKLNILRRTNFIADKLLTEIEQDERLKTYKNEIIYWRGWNYIFKEEWDQAEKEFTKIDSNHQLKIFCKNVNEKKYSTSFAKLISVFLPGSGQIYTGNYLSGLMSLGWNFLFGYLSINAFIEERIFDGLMITNFLWLRFYNGNIQNAEKFSEQMNLQISNTALHYLQYEYKGIKP